MSAPRPGRADLTQEIAFYEALAAQAKDAAKQRREVLSAQAQREWEDDGCAPSWRLRDLGLVSTRITEDSVTVVNALALAAWVAERHPDEIVPTVRSSYLTALLASVKVDGETVVDKHGEVVPGLKFEPGGRFLGITVTVNREAKEVFGVAALDALRRAEAAIGKGVGEAP